MKLKVKIAIGTVIGLIIVALMGLIIYHEVPRLSYAYEKSSDTYFVKKAYGNAKSYYIPSYHKGKKVVGIGLKAFQNKSKLEALDLDSDLELEYIDTLAFYNCDSLKEITFPDSILRIGKTAFLDCNNLERVSFTKNSKLKILDGSVFYDCNNLKYVSLPKSLREIGSYCFKNTNILEMKLYYYTELNVNALDSVARENITILYE